MPFCRVADYTKEDIALASNGMPSGVEIFYQLYGHGDTKVLLITGVAATYEKISRRESNAPTSSLRFGLRILRMGNRSARVELEEEQTCDPQKGLQMAHGDWKAMPKIRKIKKKDHSKNSKRIMKDGLGEASAVDVAWANSLSDSQLDLMVSVKHLATERLQSTKESSLRGLLTPTALRTIGVILEEFMKDRICNSSSVSSVEVDRMETNHIEMGAGTSSADEVDENTTEALESLQDNNKGSTSALVDGSKSPVYGRQKHRKRKEKLQQRKG